jgi:hypothetical protein
MWESGVSSLFQLTPTQGKALLRATVCRYRHELSSEILAELREILTSATPPVTEGGPYEANIASDVIVEEMNRVVRSVTGKSLPLISRRRGIAKTCEIAKNTYEELDITLPSKA